MTQDIDIVVSHPAISGAIIPFLKSVAESDFIDDATGIRNAVSSKGMFQLVDQVEALKLDIYTCEGIPGELKRSDSLEIFDGLTVPIVSRADAVVSKLMWIRQGSHKSRRDVKQIYRRCNEEDLKLIHDLADQLQLTELLQTVLVEPDEF